MIYGIVLTALVLLAFSKRMYRKERVIQYPKKWFGFLYPMGLWLYDTLSKSARKTKREQERKAQAVYIKEKASDKLEFDAVKRFVLIWICLVFGTFVSIIITIQTQEIENNQLKRPAFGESETYRVAVDGMERTEYIDITVDGKQPSEEAMNNIFDEQFEKLKVSILGKNKSLEEVRTNLEFPSSTMYGIRVRWESNKPDKINHEGEIQTEEIDEAGEEVEFLVTMTYSTYQSTYQLKVILFPNIKNQDFYLNELMTNIKKRNQEEIDQEYLQLPETIDGIPLNYEMESNQRKLELFALTIAAAILIFFAGYSSLERRYKKRNYQLMIDYPSLVSKLNLLIGAGMTPRMAWERIAADYQNREQEFRYVYEEMIITKNSMKSGCPEGRAYGEFGRRCGLPSYLTLGNLLEQNLKQGVSGLNQKLEEEMVCALEERKHMALRLGEEAGTRLLLPMFLMLGIVIIVLIVPAFMSFYL